MTLIEIAKKNYTENKQIYLLVWLLGLVLLLTPCCSFLVNPTFGFGMVICLSIAIGYVVLGAVWDLSSRAKEMLVKETIAEQGECDFDSDERIDRQVFDYTAIQITAYTIMGYLLFLFALGMSLSYDSTSDSTENTTENTFLLACLFYLLGSLCFFLITRWNEFTRKFYLMIVIFGYPVWLCLSIGIASLEYFKY